jgi:hypothetical protein
MNEDYLASKPENKPFVLITFINSTKTELLRKKRALIPRKLGFTRNKGEIILFIVD